MFKKCQACHTLEEGGPHRIGPNLWGILDRPAGTAAEFRYSAALRERGDEGLVWTDQTLDAYLLKPRTFIKGGSMSFAGLRLDADRRDVIAYLRRATGASRANDTTGASRASDPDHKAAPQSPPAQEQDR